VRWATACHERASACHDEASDAWWIDQATAPPQMSAMIVV
jgi:hypothetical protein